MKQIKYIKTTLKEYLNEDNEYVDETFIKNVKFNDKIFTLHKIADNPLKTQFYLNTIDGDSYIDINKILPDNMLIDAIWVKVGGKEEEIADELDFLTKTDKTTVGGYNTYIMYNIKNN